MNFHELRQYFMEFEKIQEIQMLAFDKTYAVDLDKSSDLNEFSDLNKFSDSSKFSDSNRFPDLDAIIFERKRAFENLRSAISLAPLQLLNQFKENANKIINRDKIFMLKLEDKKNELLKKINQNAKGKQLLKGYRGQSVQTLRFMNSYY